MIFTPVIGCDMCVHPVERGDTPYCCAYHHQMKLIQRKERTETLIRQIKSELKIRGNFYFITFTAVQEDPKELVENWNKFVHKSGNVVRAQCLELTENGIPHIHGLIEREKYLDYRMCARANKGLRVDVQKAKVLSAVQAYIAKLETKPPPEFLLKYKKSIILFNDINVESVQF